MDSEKKRWLDEPRHVDLIFRVLGALCAGLVVFDLFYEKHPHFGLDGIFGFYGLFGFVACVLLVLAAKHGLRPVVKRDEDYYDR
jgi:hypothetical protein